MSKAQLVITAVLLEGRSKSEVARDYDVSRHWVQQLCQTLRKPRATRPTFPAHDAHTTARRPPPSKSKTASSCCARP